MKKEMWCIIPAYNEEKTIRKLIDDCKAEGFMTIVIDDGSTDNTTKEIMKSKADIALQHPKNRGKGECITTARNYLVNNGLV